MKNERIKFVERLSVLSVAVAMLAGCAGIHTASPPVVPADASRVAQYCTNVAPSVSGRATPQYLYTCATPPPEYTVETVFISNRGYNFDTDSLNVTRHCYFFGNILYQGNLGCRKALPTACKNTNKWGCVRTLNCEQMYAKDRELAPYAAQAYLMVGTDALALLAIPPIAEGAAAALGVSVAYLKTAGGLAMFVAYYRGYWSSMTQADAVQYIKEYTKLSMDEKSKGCITDIPVGP